MSILTQIANSVATTADSEPPRPKSMQDVHDDAIAAEKIDEASAIKRLADYFGAPLVNFIADVEWFDDMFPLAQSAGQVPGRERSFWKSREAYNKWRNKVRRRIQHSTGEVAEKLERDARQDDWTELINKMHELTGGTGPIHSAQAGAVAPFADLARQFDLGPRDLDHVSIVKLLDKAPSVPKRDKMLRVLKLLKSYLHIKQVAQYLPDTIDIEAAQRRIKNVLPAHVDAWIGEVIEVGRLSNARFDKTTGKHSDAWEPTTVATYTSAMRRYVWSASKEHGGLIDLEALTDFSKLFTEEVALTVVADWNNRSETPNRMSARSAYEYISAIMTVLDRNDMDAEHLGEVRSNSAFLMQGKNATIEMSPKNIAFCRPIIESPHERRRFLTQHFAYRDRAEHILATDKTLTASQLREARMYGTCACFAAIELCGAPNRVSNVLQLRHRGPTANLFLPNRHADHYEIALVRNEMKVKKGKQVPRQKVRRNKLEGAQTLEWYLKTIRPLFQYGNPRWCAGDNQPLDNVRFGKVTDPSQRAESIYLFVANESASHLSKSRFYIYLCEASEAIGMPMTPHNYRHGVASILLKRSLANVSKVATMLNNTPAIVLQNYAWINEEAVIEETQGEIVEEAFQ